MKNKKKFILVAASMSAGKSSLINALIGNELLPAGNEATTTKIARISAGFKTKPIAKAYSDSGSIVESSKAICGEQIKVWNSSDEISAFDIVIPYSGSEQHSMLAEYTLIDTPGANNSRDGRHKEQFIKAIKDYPESPILYVLNATQLGRTDDAEIIIDEMDAQRPSGTAPAITHVSRAMRRRVRAAQNDLETFARDRRLENERRGLVRRRKRGLRCFRLASGRARSGWEG